MAGLQFNDLTGLSKPITKLIESVAAGVGVLYEPRRIRERAKAEADAVVFSARAEVEASELLERTGRRVADREVRRQTNLESILARAVDALPEEVADDPVEEDWVHRFIDAAQDIGSAEVQSLWARILAGEVAQPGSYSLRSLEALRLMDRRDAATVEILANYTMRLESEPVLVRSHAVDQFLDQNGLGILARQHLHALGILQSDLVNRIDRGGACQLLYGDTTLVVRNEQIRMPGRDASELPLYTYTSVGREILSLCDTVVDRSFVGVVVEYLSAADLTVSIVEAGR